MGRAMTVLCQKGRYLPRSRGIESVRLESLFLHEYFQLSSRLCRSRCFYKSSNYLHIHRWESFLINGWWDLGYWLTIVCPASQQV